MAFGGEKLGDHYQHKQVARVAYEVWVGPIPKGHRVIQKCGDTSCLNPDHLFTKDQRTFYLDMQAESMASRYIREDAKPRRYRLSPNQVREVDGMLRTTRLGLMEGRLTQAESEREMLKIEQYVAFIVSGCCAPSVEQAVGMEIPEDRRWEVNGLQPPQSLRGTLPARSKHGNIGTARDRLTARQKKPA